MRPTNKILSRIKRGIALAVCALMVSSFSAPDIYAATVPVPEGITPVTWEVSEDHLMIEGEEARALYNRIVSGDYPSLEELKANPIVKELDQLSAYYSELYGDTSKINTPERDQLRENILKKFLERGSARTTQVRADGSHVYAYDGPLRYEYQAVIVMGLPASGKSTRCADPISESLGAYNFDSDIIKEMLPEFQESHGAAAQSVHQESREILNQVVKRFIEGDRKGCNVVIQTIGNDLESMKSRYIEPFEKAGYNVKVVLVEAKVNESLSRAVMRGLKTGRIIPSSSIIGYGTDPDKVYNQLATMTNSKGEPYAYDMQAASTTATDTASTTAADANTSATDQTATADPDSEYVIVKGDTLYALAKRFKVTLDYLVSWNGISDPNLIFPGQILKYSAAAE